MVFDEAAQGEVSLETGQIILPTHSTSPGFRGALLPSDACSEETTTMTEELALDTSGPEAMPFPLANNETWGPLAYAQDTCSTESLPEHGQSNSDSRPDPTPLSPIIQCEEGDMQSLATTHMPECFTGIGFASTPEACAGASLPNIGQPELVPGAHASDLVGQELLDEIEPGDWKYAQTSQLGYDTASDSLTPTETQNPQPFFPSAVPNHDAQGLSEGLMCIDQWDWKTDAPEFVPGTVKGMMGIGDPQFAGTYHHNSWAMHAMSNRGESIPGSNGVGDNVFLGQMRSHHEWELRMKSEELQEAQSRVGELEMQIAQLRASWDVDQRNLHSLHRQIAQFRAVLERYCIPVEEALSNKAMSYSVDESQGPQFHHPYEAPPLSPSPWNPPHITPVTGKGCGGMGGNGSFPGTPNAAGTFPSAPTAFGSTAFGNSTSSTVSNGVVGRIPDDAAPSSTMTRSLSTLSACSSVVSGESSANANSLDTKMRQLNSLLQEGSAKSQRWGTTNGMELVHRVGRCTSGAVASTLRAIFPHVVVRTGAPGEGGTHPDPSSLVEPEVEPRSERLEDLSFTAMQKPMPVAITQESEEQINPEEYALCLEKSAGAGGHRTLRSLPTPRGAKHVLQQVGKKVDKWCAKTTKEELAGKSRIENEVAGADGHHSRRARKVDEEGDAFDSTDSEGAKYMRSLSWPPESGPPKAPDEIQKTSWADLHSGDDEDVRDDHEHWTPHRTHKATRNGFELRQRGNRWDLKISMAGSDPPLTEVGMERYCKWLRARLTAFREEHGPDSMLHCRGEADFSHCHMTNQMVWKLLEMLAQFEVHIALLKLYANHISQGGVLAICEFIRMNERAEALQELHLSHNEIDDEAALELLRTLHNQRPRYPPRRACEGTGEIASVPVWLRLNHNKIRDPQHVLKAAESEGISYCLVWDRQACGTSKCYRRDCPLVHLFCFSVQFHQTLPANVANGEINDSRSAGKRRRGRKMGIKDETTLSGPPRILRRDGDAS